MGSLRLTCNRVRRLRETDLVVGNQRSEKLI